MAKIVKKSPAPLYLAAAVWAAWAVLAPLYAWWHFALAAAVSAAAWLGGRKLFPDKVLILPDPEPAPEPEPEHAAPEDPLAVERARALAELRRLDENIEDAKLSAQIVHMEEVTGKIFDIVAGQPAKLPQLRRFLNYYLPTTLKLLNAYDRMGAAGVEGANIDGTMGRIDAMMDKVVEAFDKQLDALFADEALDISTDITVLEQMLAQEGLGGMQMGQSYQWRNCDMADKTDLTPELTLTPNLDAAAAAEAPQAPEAPALTLDPTGAVDAAAAQKAKDEQAIQLDESKLTEAERKMVDDFAKQIDLTDSNVVLQYGAAAQKNIAGFSESTLNSVRTKDLGEIGQALSSLVVELKGFGKEEDEKGIFGFFKKKKNELEAMKVAYTKAEANVDKIAEVLEGHQVTLMKDIAMLDQMYELNTKYYKELTMYILAGKKRLNQIRANELEQLRQKAAQSGTQEDAQAYNDLTNMCSRFEKKLHDLELTRMISIQMGPQTRLIQNNDTLMLEKIQSSLVNTIPLWKSQMVLSLGLEHSRQATAAQSAVTNMTNELLKKNADMLKMGTIETAREAERSVVDIQTLQHTNEQLISTLDEVMNIQREGAQKRREAEAELGRIEGQLKQKLLELRG